MDERLDCEDSGAAAPLNVVLGTEHDGRGCCPGVAVQVDSAIERIVGDGCKAHTFSCDDDPLWEGEIADGRDESPESLAGIIDDPSCRGVAAFGQIECFFVSHYAVEGL